MAPHDYRRLLLAQRDAAPVHTSSPIRAPRPAKLAATRPAPGDASPHDAPFHDPAPDGVALGHPLLAPGVVRGR